MKAKSNRATLSRWTVRLCCSGLLLAASLWAIPATAGPPPPLDCISPDGADAKTVVAAQRAWAKHLGETSHEKTFPVEMVGKFNLEMVLIPPGKYYRGEGNSAAVITLTQPLWVGKYEVTQQQYEAVMGNNPSHVFQGRVQASLVDAGGESIQTVTVNESEAVIVERATTAFSTTMAELDAFTFDAPLQRDVGGLIAPAINGGSSWEGWTLQGVSNQLGIYGSGSTADVYKVYTTVFRFDNHTVSGSPVGSDGFAPGKFSAGAFANGNTILGIGVERVSGSPIAVPTVKFDLGNDSYKAASTVGGADGQTHISHAHGGDFNTQFHYGNDWTPETLAVFDGPGSVDQLTGNKVGYDYAFRSFAVFDPESNQTRAYQLFFDLDAMKTLYGPGHPGVGIGDFGSELTFAINGMGSNHAVVRDLSIVPRTSRQPRREK